MADPGGANATSPGLSLIIPVYNGEKTLPDTLRSVFSLDPAADEVIVVDDASTDRTAALAGQAGARVLRLEKNQGPAHARNHGAREARFDILVFTDSDVLVPKQLRHELQALFQETGTDAVQGTFSEVCPHANYFSQYKNLYNRYVLNELPDWIDTTFTSLTAVRRSSFLACGGFDENIRGASVEDRTLGRNLRRQGFRIRLDRTIEVIHNKKLTPWGFIQNQFRRSRDLAKLLLRNRSEPPAAPEKTVAPVDASGRFGTNAFSTMVRIPMAYGALGLLVLAGVDWIFAVFAGWFFLVFLYLIIPFEMYLVKKRGIQFALQGIPVNFVDALVSGLGVASGLVEFWFLGRKY
ncbi:MAG: glycosyltransferase family 2 protein [bacterium]